MIQSVLDEESERKQIASTVESQTNPPGGSENSCGFYLTLEFNIRQCVNVALTAENISTSTRGFVCQLSMNLACAWSEVLFNSTENM